MPTPSLIERLKALLPHIPTQEELNQAYLDQAVNAYDLECRLAEIDRRSQRALWNSQNYPFGLQ